MTECLATYLSQLERFEKRKQEREEVSDEIERSPDKIMSGAQFSFFVFLKTTQMKYYRPIPKTMNITLLETFQSNDRSS